MIEVEVFVADASAVPERGQLEHLCAITAERLDVRDGHVAIEFVDSERIAELNLEHRGKGEPTDVLSFPIDGIDPEPSSTAGGDAFMAAVPRELGDIVICAEHTADIEEAVVHGMLHLLGMDHEVDDGEMLSLQDDLLTRARG